MARKKKKYDEPKLTRTSFNGISLIEEPEGVSFIKNADSFHAHYGRNYLRTSVNLRKISGDEIQLGSDGRIMFDSSVRTMTSGALRQLLSLLRIPSGYAKRIPTSLLITTINTLLAISSSKLFMLRLGEQNTVIGIWRGKANVVCSTYDAFSYVLNNTAEDEVVFHFIAANKSKSAMMLEYVGMKDEDTSAGVEILHSDDNSVKPTVTGYLFNPLGHAMIRATRRVANSESSVQILKNSLTSAVAVIRGEMPKYLAAYKNMANYKVSPELALKISERSSKALKTPIKVEAGGTLLDAFSSLSELRKKTKNSLKEKREIAMFAGSLVSLATI